MINDTQFCETAGACPEQFDKLTVGVSLTDSLPGLVEGSARGASLFLPAVDQDLQIKMGAVVDGEFARP